MTLLASACRRSVLAVVLAAGGARATPCVALAVAAETAEAETEDAVLPQLRSELGAGGFAVVLVPVAPPLSRDGLEEAARSGGCFAAIGITGREPALDIWVTDRVTGKTVLRRIDAPAEAPRASALVALRAAELLRASLLELNVERPPNGEVRAEPEVRAWVKPTAPFPAAERAPAPPRVPRFGAAIGVAAFVAPGGLPPAITPGAVVSWRATSAWLGELALFAPALGRLDAFGGSAMVDQELGLVGARRELAVGVVRPSVGLAVGAFRLGARGVASPPLRASSDQRWSFAAALGAGARADVAPRLAIVGDVRVIGLYPRPLIRFAGREVATTGRPLVVVALGGELAW